MSAEATNISKLSIITEAKSGEAVKSLQSLASALNTLKNASKGSFAGLNRAAESIKTLMKQIHSINDADVKKLTKLANAMSKVNGVSLKVSQMRNAAANASKVNASGKTIGQTVGGAATAGRGAGGTAPSLDSATGNATPKFDKVAAQLAQQNDAEWKKIEAANAQRAQEAMKRLTAPFKKIGQFFSSISRIAMYRLIRRGLQIISEGIKEGYQNALEWSRLNNTSLYPSVMRIKTAALVMKNQLGAAAGELIQTLEPALIQLAQVVTSIAEQFANMFAVIGGRGQYMRAKKNIDTLTEAQGKLNRTILAFDEINKLNGDSGYGNVSINDMFEMVDVNVKEANTLKATLTAIAAIVAGIRLTSFIMDLKDAIMWAGKLATALGGGSAAGAGGAAAGAGAGSAGAGSATGGVFGAVAAGVLAVAGAIRIAKTESETQQLINEVAEKNGLLPERVEYDAGISPEGASAKMLDAMRNGTMDDYMANRNPYSTPGLIPFAEKRQELVKAQEKLYDFANVPPQNQTFPWAVGLPSGVNIPENQEITLTILDQSGAVLSSDPLSKYYADSIRVGSVIVGNGSVR